MKLTTVGGALTAPVSPWGRAVSGSNTMSFISSEQEERREKCYDLHLSRPFSPSLSLSLSLSLCLRSGALAHVHAHQPHVLEAGPPFAGPISTWALCHFTKTSNRIPKAPSPLSSGHSLGTHSPTTHTYNSWVYITHVEYTSGDWREIAGFLGIWFVACLYVPGLFQAFCLQTFFGHKQAYISVWWFSS